jgi:GH18 family chitinase
VADLEENKLSHVLYAFANVNRDGTIVVGVNKEFSINREKSMLTNFYIIGSLG